MENTNKKNNNEIILRKVTEIMDLADDNVIANEIGELITKLKIKLFEIEVDNIENLDKMLSIISKVDSKEFQEKLKKIHGEKKYSLEKETFEDYIKNIDSEFLVSNVTFEESFDVFLSRFPKVLTIKDYDTFSKSKCKYSELVEFLSKKVDKIKIVDVIEELLLKPTSDEVIDIAHRIPESIKGIDNIKKDYELNDDTLGFNFSPDDEIKKDEEDLEGKPSEEEQEIFVQRVLMDKLKDKILKLLNDTKDKISEFDIKLYSKHELIDIVNHLDLFYNYFNHSEETDHRIKKEIFNEIDKLMDDYFIKKQQELVLKERVKIISNDLSQLFSIKSIEKYTLEQYFKIDKYKSYHSDFYQYIKEKYDTTVPLRFTAKTWDEIYANYVFIKKVKQYESKNGKQ